MLVDLGRNDLSRVCVPGLGARRALHGARALLARDASRLGGRRGAARRRARRSSCCARRFPAGTVSGAPKVRAMQIISELEQYRRGIYAGAVGYCLPETARARHVHRDPHAVAARRRRAPAGGRRHRRRLGSGRRARGVPRQAARARDRDRAGRVGAGRGAVILLIDNYDSFSYNLAHLFGALGAEVVVRRNDELDADEAERLAPSHLVVSPGPGRPADAGATTGDRRAAAADDADARRLPRPPGARRGLRRRGRLRARARPRQGEPGAARRQRPLHRSAGSVRGRALPLARRDAAARRARADGVRGRRRGDGGAAPRAARRSASSSIPSRC